MLGSRLPSTGPLQIGAKLYRRPTTTRPCNRVYSSPSSKSKIEAWPMQENDPPNIAWSMLDFYQQVYRPPSPLPKEGSRPTIKQLPRGSACAVVLGGAMADSRRLYPLTQNRTLPAVPFASNYRLIDIVLSNLVNSNVRQIFVLTQYNSKSLNSYLQKAYDLGVGVHLGGEGYVEVVAAAQGPEEKRFAEGSVDVVRQWMNQFNSNSKNKWVEDIIVLPSDQVYQADFTQMLDFHRNSGADITIVCKSVEERNAQLQGIVKMGGGARIQSFVEKPDAEQLSRMTMSMAEIEDFYRESNIDEVPFEVDADPNARALLGSCGMYIFRKDALQELIEDAGIKDIGKHLIPTAVNKGLQLFAFNHPGFWTDIGGSVQSFYDFHMGLARDEVPFRLQQPLDTPFFHSPTCLSPTGTSSARMCNVVVGSGCELGSCTLRDSVLGQRTIIADGCYIEGAVIMGSSFYERERPMARVCPISPSYPPMGIGSDTIIRRAILDKNVRVGKNVQLVNKDGLQNSVGELPFGICVKDGIMVVPKNAAIPDGTVL
ncbi:ADP-glucose pyrophosphorylase large subunit [Dunaliella salina]|uniref:glucose-1-phosphate adenylyltransferase n=1 Tax=Dunaliella salina TaxID=3046 RepID=A0ABQ7FXK3_DUNSA|nr:ADP-glucose pyrophosphorylase large subunit [Dunaliella salina]|eukprot:KAF5827088.1 ADP-glucose pyrophosphorylase large subunit [Dunaliella salina]